MDITLLKTLDSAVQTNKTGDARYKFGTYVYFQDKANYPKGTPRDSQINVIRDTKGASVVIARVATEKQAISAIESDSGLKVTFQKATSDRATDRAERRNS